MRLVGWIGRHRALAAFAAGVGLTVAALAVVGYLVLSDQRRTARVLSAALSHALAREVRIERVTDVTTERFVLHGVELPREGGWPARIVADRVEATGPLLAVARGDAAPVRLTVARPTVELPAGEGAGVDLGAVESVRQALAGFLARPLALDVALTGGTARYAGGAAEFDLTLRKASGEARAELTVRAPRAAPLVLTLAGHVDGDTTRLAVTGRGGLGPLAAWLPAATAAATKERVLDLALDVDLTGPRGLAARGRLAMGDALVAAGTVTVAKGVLEAALPSASADLAFVATLVGLAWTPTGRAELSGVTATWPSDPGAGPTIRAGVRIPAATLPPAAFGTEIAVQGLEGRVALEPAGSQRALAGDVRAARLGVAGLDTAPVEVRYRVVLAGGRVARADLDRIAGRVEGGALQGSAAYDGAGGRLEARLAGDDVDAAGLVRRLAPGWLEPADRVRLQGLVLTASGLDVAALAGGAVRLEARGLRWQRSSGEVQSGRLVARADLAGGGARGLSAALEADRVAATLPAFAGEVPGLTATADLARGDAGWSPRRAAVTARDREGRELVVASLQPAPAAGRLALTARAPALERLDGFYPALPRRLNGSARLDVEVSGAGFADADGRLVLDVPEGELAGGKVSLRDVAAAVPLRRGSAPGGEPPWGRITIGELIAYGVVARDLTTPARVYRDRLSLNDLTYSLYSGEGKGWSEVELGAAGLAARGQLTGDRVRIEEFIGAYGIRGGTMTGLLRYGLDYQYRAGQLALKGRFEVPEGGAVNIELLNRLLAYAESDPSGVVRSALENLREFDYKSAEAEVHTVGSDIRVSLSLRGRERFLIFPPRVKEINVRNLPLSFLARQFPGALN